MEILHDNTGVWSTRSVASAAADQPLQGEEDMDLRRGPWTVEEDLILVNYIANHGEGRWNSLSRCAGLKRTGKSCRLRWLNYLRPDVRRGNITPEEQLLILELHSRWGNRWSKIAQHLPGRTDNEIKNYWRTRVQKHAKQLQCDVNSKQFKDIMRYLWMPRLIERIQAAAATSSATAAAAAAESTMQQQYSANNEFLHMKPSPENSSMAGSSMSDSMVTQLTFPPTSSHVGGDVSWGGEVQTSATGPNAAAAAGQFGGCSESLPSPCGYMNQQEWTAFDQNGWSCSVDQIQDSFWSLDDIWSSQQQQQF